MLSRITLAAIVCITIAGCSNESEFVDLSFTGSIFVDPALEPFFDTFEAAANERGITLTDAFREIEGRLENIGDREVVGECWYGGYGPNEVRIDLDYWQNASDLDREFVVFHELGHCYLDRVHTDASTASGRCISIMSSGVGACYDRYNNATREQYLDELFFGR